MKKINLFKAGRRYLRPTQHKQALFKKRTVAAPLKRHARPYLKWLLIALPIIISLTLLMLFLKKDEAGLSYSQDVSQAVVSRLKGAPEKERFIRLVISDVGLSEKLLSRVKNLPEETVLLFSPYAAEVMDKFIDENKSRGNIFLRLPFNEKGERSLAKKLGRAENMIRLGHFLTLGKHVKKAALPMAIKNDQEFSFVINVLSYSGFEYEFFDFKNAVILDEEMSSSAILNKIKKIDEVVAGGNIPLVVVQNPKKLTLDILERYLAENKNLGVKNEPLSP